MVRFVGVDDMARLVGSIGVGPFLSGLAEAIAFDFRRWEAFDKVARLASHSRDGVIELMPASDDALYSFKYVNGHPRNTRDGLQTVTAMGLLADVATGYPLLVSEMTLLTALRTAATSALAARHLARPDSRSMAVIGLGAQSEFQALAFAALLGITDLRVFDIDPAATAKFVRNLAPLGFRIREAGGAAEAVRGADIVTTATADKLNATVITDAMAEPGQHLNAVGGDCPGKTEIDPAVLRRASVFVEFPDQTRVEGEIQRLPDDFPVVELWRVIAFQARDPSRGPDAIARAAYEEVSRMAVALDAAGVTVHLFEDETAGRPDAVFPNNWFSTHAGGHVALYPMFSASRRGERRADVVEMLKDRYRVQDVIDYSGLERDGVFLEGTGAMVLDHVERVAYAARSHRADPVALERFCTHFNFEPVAFEARDAGGMPIYHTNVMMGIGAAAVLVGLDTVVDPARRHEVRDRLAGSGRAVVALSQRQVAEFAGNAIELRGRDGPVLALSSRALRALDPDQVRAIERGARILALDVPTIELAGGSVRCMLAGIHLAPRGAA